MINISDYCINELTVSFITKLATYLQLQFDLKLKINVLVIFVIPQWEISGWISPGATIVVTNVRGFPLSWSGYIHVGFPCEM